MSRQKACLTSAIQFMDLPSPTLGYPRKWIRVHRDQLNLKLLDEEMRTGENYSPET